VNNQGLWLKVTRLDDVPVLVNFEQVIAILPHQGGASTSLLTGAGEIVIKETIDYIQSNIPI